MHELVKSARPYASIKPSQLLLALNHSNKISLNFGLSSYEFSPKRLIFFCI